MTYRIVYLAGPMSGLPDYNYPAFDAAEIEWREAGWLVESPTKSGRDWGFEKPYHFYMAHAVSQLLRSNAIAMLPGWESSPGAALEFLLSRALGYPAFDAITFEPLHPESYELIIKWGQTDSMAQASLSLLVPAFGS